MAIRVSTVPPSFSPTPPASPRLPLPRRPDPRQQLARRLVLRVLRRVRNDMYAGLGAEQYWRTLDWIYTAPDYVREFRAKV